MSWVKEVTELNRTKDVSCEDKRGMIWNQLDILSEKIV